MKYKIAFGFLFIFFSSAFAQKKELTIKESVMGQYREFRPEKIMQFQWLNDENTFAYLQHYTCLVKDQINDQKEPTTFCIDALNQSMGTDFNWFSGLEWKNENEFYIAQANKYYLINFDKKAGNLIATLPDSAENAVLNTQTGHIAYTIENNLYIHMSSGDFAITSNKDKNIVSGQAIARREFGITNGIFWSPKGNFLAFYQKDETYVADYPLLNINTTPGSLLSIKYPMAGQMSERPRVGIYNLATKKTIFISPTGDIDDFLTNLSWTPNEKYVLIAELNRDQNHMKLNRFDANTGQFVNTIYEEQNKIWTEPEHPAYFYSASSENFIWISEKDGFDNLYLMNTEKGLTKQLTQNKWVAKEIVGHNPKGTIIYFTGTGASPLDTKLFAVNIGSGKQQCLTEVCGTHEGIVSLDGKYLFDQYSSHSIPNKAIIAKCSNNKTIRPLVDAENKLKNYQIGKAEISHLKSKDGFDLYTRMILPSDFDSTKQYPVLVYVYGGPHAQLITNSWLDGASLWMYWMAEQGYIIFTLDGRGSANRGFAFESVIHRQLGTEELKDQLIGVDYLKSLPYVDTNRLAIHGWSFGGFMTTSMMLRNPSVFTTAVAGGPVTDWKYYEVMYGERYMDRPEQNPEGYQKASLLNKTKNLEGKLLLIHGGVDDVVVMQHDLALLKSFIKNEVQVDFFMYPTHQHNVRGKDRVHLMTKVLNYILRNNQ